MTTVKKILTHIFVVVVNFYLLTFFFGLFLMLWTALIGQLNIWLVFSSVLLSLLISIVYQITRAKWDVMTIGEIIIGSTSRENIIQQSTPFTLTRIPIFLLILVTLALNGNMQDGLSEEQTIGIGIIISLGLMFSFTYYGLKNFFIKPGMLPIFLIACGLLLVGIGLKFSPKAPQTKELMFKLETTLAIIWVATGFLYKYKTKKVRQSDNDIA